MHVDDPERTDIQESAIPFTCSHCYTRMLNCAAFNSVVLIEIVHMNVGETMGLFCVVRILSFSQGSR